jgi:Tol biopolymer transport system component
MRRSMVLCALAVAVPVSAHGVWRPARTRVFDVRQGSDFALAVARDGRIAIDLQGSLWIVPPKGGRAYRVTDDRVEAMRPDWSPDGRWLVVQSYADGMWHLWRVTPDGRRRRLTDGPYDDTAPRVSPDGRQIAFLSGRGGQPGLWLRDEADGRLTRVPVTLTAPTALTWQGQGWVVVDAGRLVRIDAQGRRSDVPDGCDARGKPAALAAGPGGLAYVCAGPEFGALMRDGHALPTAPDVFPYPPGWDAAGRLVYAGHGQIRRIDPASGRDRAIPFVARFRLARGGYARKRYDFDSTAAHPAHGIVAPVPSPDGRRVAFKALGALWLREADGSVHRLPTQGWVGDPAWSPDGRSLVLSSDASGLMQLWRLDLDSGAMHQVSQGAHAHVGVAWSPDGTTLAWQNEAGETWLTNLASGRERLLVKALDFPGRPSWSPDGRTIAMTAADAMCNRILLVDVASGAQRWIDPAPWRSVSTRGDDGPVWSPDGHWLAFSMMSTIWALPVGPDGSPTGPARRLTREASDAPAWSGTSLVYLAGGVLKRVGLDGGPPETLPIDLSWHQAVQRGTVLVHAGRLWDGLHRAVRRNVDILVRDNRIAAIIPHRPHRAGLRVIDASGLTVTPGLFEMHNHQQLHARYLGDRQGRLWLAYGITATRSTGDPAYRALEDKEALASGARIGPRHFMTGEMLEGSRLLWSFSRPVEDAAQLRLELSRAQALGYDVIKTYMRFRSDWQEQVARFGHRAMGVSTTSHFMLPGVAHGVDGEEHFLGPTRWNYGFPHLFRGDVYGDVFATLGRGAVEVTTTDFAGRQDLLDLPGLPDDPRLRALYPPWEMASLRQFIGCAGHTGPCDFFLTPDAAQSHLTARDLIRARRAGAAVMVGSDAPLDSFVVSTFQNLYALQKNGLSPFAALQAATIVPARAQGVDADMGGIAVGKLADLVLVRGRPERDVRDLMQVEGTMLGGRMWRRAELLGPYSP